MKYIFTLFIAAFTLSTFAQKKPKVTYFKNDGREVKSKDNPDFTRAIQPLNDGTTHATLTETYQNGNPKRFGKILNLDGSIRFEGEVIFYYESGIKSKVENFKDNQLLGISSIYNIKGNLKEQRDYLSDGNYKLVQYVDSTGKKLLDVNSSGFMTINYSDGNTEYGNYLNGFKDGLWKLKDISKNESYEDIYEVGVFKSGKTFEVDGSISTYQIFERKPQFPGGSRAMGNFIAKSLTYPVNARANKIQGRVIVGYKINKNGSPSDFRIIKSVSKDLDEEAIRVAKLLPDWFPGIRRGKPYSDFITFPVIFQLAY